MSKPFEATNLIPPATMETNLGLVSIIIPVHNRLEYLAHAIESALRQSYPKVEVIVVDDGSPADPGPITSRFDDGVRLVRKSNGGLASARNFGIAHARGEYLLFLDDDDFLEPTALQDLLEALAGYPSASWAAGRYEEVDSQGALAHRPRLRYDSGDVYQSMIHHNLMGAPSVVLAFSHAVHAVSAFDETPCYHMAEDYDLWLKLARYSPVAVTQRKVTNYRIHSRQFTQNNPAKLIRAVLAVLHKHLAIAPPECTQDFQLAIARFELHLGDCLYLGGDAKDATPHWQAAAAAGVLSRRALRWRSGKGRLPAPLLRVLRRTRKCLKI
jgi:glycosyltransferase involved in cell wall biosynthesis